MSRDRRLTTAPQIGYDDEFASDLDSIMPDMIEYDVDAEPYLEALSPPPALSPRVSPRVSPRSSQGSQRSNGSGSVASPRVSPVSSRRSIVASPRVSPQDTVVPSTTQPTMTPTAIKPTITPRARAPVAQPRTTTTRAPRPSRTRAPVAQPKTSATRVPVASPRIPKADIKAMNPLVSPASIKNYQDTNTVDVIDYALTDTGGFEVVPVDISLYTQHQKALRPPVDIESPTGVSASVERLVEKVDRGRIPTIDERVLGEYIPQEIFNRYETYINRDILGQEVTDDAGVTSMNKAFMLTAEARNILKLALESYVASYLQRGKIIAKAEGKITVSGDDLMLNSNLLNLTL